MFVLVLAAEADETRQTVTFLIACLVGIAIALTLLTVWYWLYTDPERRRGREPSGPELLDVPPGASSSPAPSPPADGVEPAVADAAAPPDPELDRPGQRAETGVGEAPVGDRADGGMETEEDRVEADAVATGPIMARQTWDFVAAAKRAEDGPGTGEQQLPPASPRIAVPDRSHGATPDRDESDELAIARRRRERAAARGLSDEVWNSVRRSVFDKLGR